MFRISILIVPKRLATLRTRTSDIGYGDRHLDNIVFEKRFTNSSFVQCIDRDVGFFEAWVSVFDGVLNWKSRLSTIAIAGETEYGSAGTQPHEG